MEQIKALIEKIQIEGVQVAQEKASQIEQEARRRAAEITAQAQAEAERIRASAKADIDAAKKNSQVLLQQAARDLLLVLRKEIFAMLQRLTVLTVREALSAEALSVLIIKLIKDAAMEKKPEAAVTVRKEDLEKLKKHLLGELGKEAGAHVELRPSDEIQAGFIISFDAGKSHLDFSDVALAEYIGKHLKPELEEILSVKNNA
jgi:V/A-type H+/Na+-transporting ATPase subunit E